VVEAPGAVEPEFLTEPDPVDDLGEGQPLLGDVNAKSHLPMIERLVILGEGAAGVGPSGALTRVDRRRTLPTLAGRHGVGKGLVPMVRNRIAVPMVATVVIALTVMPAGANGRDGFVTPQAAMLGAAAPGVTVHPLLTVGETLPNGFRFEAIPDGIALDKRNGHRVDVYVNHETSLVPFPYVAAGPTIANSLNDFDNAQVSKLTLSTRTGGVLDGTFAIPSSANYQRFCSNFLATKEQGFNRRILFTNEEATDVVYRTGNAWPVAPAPGADGSDPEQAGVVVAYDVKKGTYTTIYGMGRFNHENAVPVPGYEGVAILSGDDTFSAPSSQMYLYTARNANAVLADEGSLWAFVSDDAAVNDYGDLTGSDTVSGEFIEVPRDVAVGDQTGLENWSNANNVFQFIRIEDIAYDRNDHNVVYFADTGEPRAVADPTTGRLRRAPAGTQGPYPNGRLFKMVLDEHDPTVVRELSILIAADAGGYNNVDVIHQPDNVETTKRSLLIQEDPGSHNNASSPTFPNATNARIWQFDLTDGSLTVVAEVVQAADPNAAKGTWESSGIVDASAVFGQGAFLVDVQAHSLFVDTAPGPDFVNPPPGPDWLYKREGGQLLLLRIPGV
jgi:Bacterial protein of unknown function (DUF839)